MFEYASRMAATARRSGGFLARLFRDRRGNTLVIVGAAMIPLAAMIGSGVDMSRAYMAKTRLQSACDAAALAGRRVMQNDSIGTNVETEARRFFHFNFPKSTNNGVVTGPYQTAEIVNPTVTRPAAGTVRVSASTTIPTTVMRMFGFTTLPLSVTCDASLNFVNTDVMLVLDVTGSMAWDVSGNPTSVVANQRITALRDAVMALYDELRPIQTQLESNGLRLRYGVVPYSSTVNVGRLISGAVPVPFGGNLPGNPAYIADNATYSSRVANYDEPHATYVGTPQAPEAPVTQTYGSSISQSNCDKYGRNVNFTGFSASATTGGGPAPTRTWTRAFANDESDGVDWGWSGSGDTSGDNRACRRRYVETDTTYQTVVHYESSGWIYKAESLNVSQYKLGNPVTISNTDAGQSPVAGDFDPVELPGAVTGESTSSVTWNGCIQERDTALPSLITSSTPSNLVIPPTAYDLNINLIPSTDATRWRPMFPEAVYRRAAGTGQQSTGTSMVGAACPAEARRLQAWTRADMLAYVNALTPVGSTYHDIGMLWGARLLSSGGIFADSPDTYNSMPVSRHIIFMTDGQMDTANDAYAFHGIERNDQKVAGQNNPSETDLNGRHMQRFRMICNAAKSMGYSVWVIAFGTTLTTDMIQCATNANQASTVSNRDALIDRFQEIGSNIGALRLTQ
jgi:Flp pilus assembly protein TadG